MEILFAIVVIIGTVLFLDCIDSVKRQNKRKKKK
nr:MAG TPA: chitin synthase regulator [Caudoviricetes sp.]